LDYEKYFSQLVALTVRMPSNVLVTLVYDLNNV
jgi:hypothetical protein